MQRPIATGDVTRGRMTTRKPRNAGPPLFEAIGLCALGAVLAALLFLRQQQFFTGDEPRYVMYAVSILKHGRFLMTLREWHQLFLSTTGLPAPAVPPGRSGNTLMNSVYLSTLLSPVAAIFSLAGLRTVTLLAGFIGLFFLFRLCSRFSTPGAAFLTTAIAGFTIPLLPYLHLFYMETYVFALICCGWDRLQRMDRPLSGDLLTAFILIAIPFVHLRGSVVAAALYAFLLWQIYRRGFMARALTIAALGVASACILIALNIAIYGAITGPVNSARPPLPAQWFSVFAMQLSNIHHGLIAYAPIWLLGYAGLVAGTIRGGPIPRQGLVLAAIAAVTAIGINPGFCWPARFWVLAIPMLAVGLCAWWTLVKQPILKLIPAALLAFTLLNTYIFFDTPNRFLFNQQTGTTYQMAFDQLGHFNFALVWPVEVDDAQDLEGARDIAIASGVFVLLMLGAVALRRGELLAIPAVLLMIGGLDLARVSVVPQSEYGLDISHDHLAVRLHAPMKAAYIQFGRSTEMWSVPPWPRFDVTTIGSAHRGVHALLSANQVIPVSCSGTIDTVDIRNVQGFDIGSEAAVGVDVYESDSILRNSLKFLRNSC